MLPPQPHIGDTHVNDKIVRPLLDIIVLQDEGVISKTHFHQIVGKCPSLEAKLNIKSAADFKLPRWHHRVHGPDCPG